MPQDIAALVKRHALAEHVSCKAVAKQMGAHIFLGRLEARLLEGFSQNQIQDLGIIKRPVGRPGGDEQGP